MICRYTFIKNIKPLCDKGDFYSVDTVVTPLLNTLAMDKDCSIRQVTLNQLEFITKVVPFVVN